MKAKILLPVLFIFCAILFQNCKKRDCPDPDINNPNKDSSNGNGSVLKTIKLKPGPEGKDAMVMSINPNQNYDNYFGYMHAIAATWSSIPGASRIYMQFDYSAVPVNAKIQSVKLTLFADTVNVTIASQPKGHVISVGDPNGILPNEIYVKRITSAWDESTLTWNTQPFSDYGSRLELPASTDRSQAYIIDITDFAKEDISCPPQNHGLMIQLADETPYRGVTFRSSDDTTSTQLRPELNITYTE